MSVAGWTAVAALAVFFLVGIHNEERAMDRHGELHRWAVDSFRQAVRLKPKDAAARWNLELSLLQQKKEQEEQQKQQ